MIIETSWENRILIVQAEERLDSVNAQAFIDRLGSAVDGAAQGVVIDMKRLVYISHARLALCTLAPDVLGAFQTSGLAALVDIYSSRTDAVAAVGG